MYDMSPYLKKINEVIEKGPYSNNWHSLSEYEVPEWYRKAKFGIFIGVFSVSPLSEMNGTHAICMSRTVPNTNITLIPMASIPISATRILSRCSKQKNLIQRNGQSFSELQEQSMLFPLQSITTDFRCTGAKSHTGTLTKWDLTVTFSEN